METWRNEYVHSNSTSTHISLDYEWNDTPFLQEWSGQSILDGMEWSFHSRRNGVFIPFLQEGNDCIPFQPEWDEHSIPSGME